MPIVYLSHVTHSEKVPEIELSKSLEKPVNLMEGLVENHSGKARRKKESFSKFLIRRLFFQAIILGGVCILAKMINRQCMMKLKKQLAAKCSTLKLQVISGKSQIHPMVIMHLSASLKIFLIIMLTLEMLK